MAKKSFGRSFGEGFASTFAPTAEQSTMAMLRELLSRPAPEEHKLGMDIKRAQLAGLRAETERRGEPDLTRVTLTPEIIKSLPTLAGLGLEGKSVSSNALLDIRKAGKSVDPIDQFRVLADLTLGSRSLDLQAQNPDIFNAFVKRRNALAPNVLGIGLDGKQAGKPAGKPVQKQKLTAEDVGKKFGF